MRSSRRRCRGWGCCTCSTCPRSGSRSSRSRFCRARRRRGRWSRTSACRRVRSSSRSCATGPASCRSPTRSSRPATRCCWCSTPGSRTRSRRASTPTAGRATPEVADRHVDFLLIGGGIAAASCARTLRSEGASGSVLVVGREKDPPYERPPLSKAYLAGGAAREDALIVPESWWEENSVELLTRVSAMKLDVGDRVVRLSSKEEVSFGSALIATGANVRRLRADGADLDGIHYLRAFGNADALREEALAARRVVLIGGSYIGCELAATLSALGVSCSILMQEDVVLERVLGRAVGSWVQRRLEERGVDVHGGDSLARFEGSDGRVSRGVSEGGISLEGGCVAIGAGVVPDVVLARAAGLEVGVGIGSGEPVVRGSLDEDSFTAFYVDGGRVVGAATVGRSGDLDEARELIVAGDDADLAELS